MSFFKTTKNTFCSPTVENTLGSLTAIFCQRSPYLFSFTLNSICQSSKQKIPPNYSWHSYLGTMPSCWTSQPTCLPCSQLTKTIPGRSGSPVARSGLPSLPDLLPLPGESATATGPPEMERNQEHGDHKCTSSVPAHRLSAGGASCCALKATPGTRHPGCLLSSSILSSTQSSYWQTRAW